MATTHDGGQEKDRIQLKKERARAKSQPQAAQARAAGPANARFGKAGAYLREVQTELKKTNWPGKAEMIASTQVVIGLLVVVGVYIFILDTALAGIFNWAGLGTK